MTFSWYYLVTPLFTPEPEESGSYNPYAMVLQSDQIATIKHIILSDSTLPRFNIDKLIAADGAYPNEEPDQQLDYNETYLHFYWETANYSCAQIPALIAKYQAFSPIDWRVYM